MVDLTRLWLPTLSSAVFVFFASSSGMPSPCGHSDRMPPPRMSFDFPALRPLLVSPFRCCAIRPGRLFPSLSHFAFSSMDSSTALSPQ